MQSGPNRFAPAKLLVIWELTELSGRDAESGSAMGSPILTGMDEAKTLSYYVSDTTTCGQDQKEGYCPGSFRDTALEAQLITLLKNGAI